MLEINLDDTYEIVSISKNLMQFSFSSPTLHGDHVLMMVKIKTVENDFFEEYLNLSFGPEVNGEIDDMVVVQHANPSKALSTVLRCALKFLIENPTEHIGINGSDLRRAYLYFRIFLKNYEYLKKQLIIYGVKFYVRILRGNDKNDLLQIDPNELTYLPCIIDRDPIIRHKSLYNYFFVTLKNLKFIS